MRSASVGHRRTCDYILPARRFVTRGGRSSVSSDTRPGFSRNLGESLHVVVRDVAMSHHRHVSNCLRVAEAPRCSCRLEWDHLCTVSQTVKVVCPVRHHFAPLI